MAADRTMFRDALAQALALKGHEVHDPDALADEIVDLIGVYVPAGDEMALSLRLKIGSTLVHAQEIDPSKGSSYQYDLAAMKSTAEDPEVQAWLDAFPPGLLPEKR